MSNAKTISQAKVKALILLVKANKLSIEDIKDADYKQEVEKQLSEQ